MPIRPKVRAWASRSTCRFWSAGAARIPPRQAAERGEHIMANAEPHGCDILIRNACALTMDARRSVLSTGAIAITGHTIAAVGPEADIARRFRARSTIDARGGTVHPGYVDAHLHVNAQTCRGFFRGDASKG